MTQRRFAALALAAAATFTIAACGGDDSGDEPTPTTAESADTTGETSDTTAGSDSGDDECAWLTTDAASEAIGQPMELIGAGDGGCVFQPEGSDGLTIHITRTPIAIDVETYLEQSKALCEGVALEVPNGDGGWACVPGISPQGFVAFGDELITADITDAPTEEEGVQLAAKVAAQLTAG